MKHGHPNNKKQMLAQAALRAAEKGQRWTDSRAQVYEILLASHKPLGAYPILEKVAKVSGKPTKPATVYRALEALCELGLAVRIESLDAFLACQNPEHDHQHVFLVCGKCGTADEIEDHDIGKRLSNKASGHGFKTQRQILELQGLCKSCDS